MSVKLGRYKYIATQGPCPEGFHVPLSSEWQALYNIFTGLGLSGIQNWTSYLKMPLAGGRNYPSSDVGNQGSTGFCRSSTHTDEGYASTLLFNSSNIVPQINRGCAYAFSIRPFYNEGIAPNGGWQVLYQGTGSAGIYWHKDLGLITASGDGVTWVTIADKNLGATQVWNSGDTLSEENCGGYYQWGNNHMFPFTGTVTTSSTQVDASSYGPGNWYDSSIFIIGSNDWSSTDNANLWGGVDGNVWKDVESKLPDTYQEVEYIQSSGTQRIDTGIAPNDTKYGILGKFRTSGGEVLIDLSNTTSTDNKRYGFQFNGLKPQWSGIMYQQRGENNGTIDANTDYEFSYNYNGDRSFTVNGITKTGIPTGSATMPNWNIFCQNCNGSYQRFWTGRLYRLQLYHNEDKLRDFVPCYRKSDGVIGMYDTVNEAFYTNAGTGTFTKGDDVFNGGHYDYTDYSAMQGPCPSGYHIPTKNEVKALRSAISNLGLYGGPSCLTYLKMPLGGERRVESGDINKQGEEGNYWECEFNGINSVGSGSAKKYVIYDQENSRSFDFNQSYYTSQGCLIRPFKNISVAPNNSWTTLYDGSSVATGAGIFHNSSLGLISISSDGENWITIADKNLGATTIYNRGDTLSQSNCGNYFQRGNNYGFPFTGSVTKSTTRLDASNYGPGNYYSSSTFIYNTGNPCGWDSSNNTNLWGGTTGIVSVDYHVLKDLKEEYIGEYHECNVNTMGPCPSGFHVPTKDDCVKLCGILTSTFSMAANATTMGTYLKMPMAGYRKYNNANVSNVGSNGRYWSSTSYDANYAYDLYFRSSSISPQDLNFRNLGYSIRPFKNFPVIPDSSWTTLYDGSSVADFAGIFHNATDGLISISSDGTNWITIADKNLGASTIYNSGDTLSEANCGLYYQWGNNHGFPFTGTVTTSSTQVDASTYGPFTEYYDSDTFITRSSSPYDWSSVRNDNLWGGVSGNTRNCSLGGGSGFPTTVVCDFRAGAPGELTTLAQVKNPGDFIAQRGSSEIADGADGSVRIRISSTDYSAQVCLGGCGFYNSTITNLGYSNGIPDRASGKQNLIKKAYIRIKSSYGSSSGYSVYGKNGVVMYFANKQVSSNVYGSDVCCAGFPFSRGIDSGNYIWGPKDSNVQFLALPSIANVGASRRCTTYINQGVSCADSRVTLETRGTGPSDFHYWLIVEKTGNEYDLGLCSDLGWAQVVVECGDWWMSGSYRDIDEIYMEVFDNWYIDANGNITDTKPW